MDKIVAKIKKHQTPIMLTTIYGLTIALTYQTVNAGLHKEMVRQIVLAIDDAGLTEQITNLLNEHGPY